jgi:hypothetical protein
MIPSTSDITNATQQLFAKLTNSTNPAGNSLVYPSDLQDPSSGVGHYIVFNINTTTGSKYTKQTNKTVNSNGASPGLFGSISNLLSGSSAASNNNGGISALFSGNANPSIANSISQTLTGKPVIDTNNPVDTRSRLGATGNTRRSKATITLYMPESLTSGYGTAWENSDVQGGTVVLSGYDSLADGIKNLYNNGPMAMLDKIHMPDIKMANLKDDAFKGIMEGLANTSIGGGLQARFRELRNPHMSFLFKGINAREFLFTFKFTPRTPAEARTIRDIIKSFKFHSAPEVQENSVLGVFYKYPSEFDITFFSNGTKNGFLHKISTCALKDIQISYNDSGMASFHRTLPGEGAPPTHTSLTLTFQELELMTKERFNTGF